VVSGGGVILGCGIYTSHMKINYKALITKFKSQINWRELPISWACVSLFSRLR